MKYIIFLKNIASTKMAKKIYLKLPDNTSLSSLYCLKKGHLTTY